MIGRVERVEKIKRREKLNGLKGSPALFYDENGAGIWG